MKNTNNAVNIFHGKQVFHEKACFKKHETFVLHEKIIYVAKYIKFSSSKFSFSFIFWHTFWRLPRQADLINGNGGTAHDHSLYGLTCTKIATVNGTFTTSHTVLMIFAQKSSLYIFIKQVIEILAHF